MDKQALLDCWTMFRREHAVSVDRLVCSPELREAFVSQARVVCKCDEEEILWNLMSLRKKKLLKENSGNRIRS